MAQRGKKSLNNYNFQTDLIIKFFYENNTGESDSATGGQTE